MRVLGGVLLAVIAGCAHRTPGIVDPDLPEAGQRVDVEEPRAILEAAASSLDPTLRAEALGGLAAAEVPGAPRSWALRGLYDPDAWVQRRVVQGLASRPDEEDRLALLAEWAAYGSADPAARALALRAVGDRADASAIAAAERSSERAAPLLLEAARRGDADAVSALQALLRRADLGLEAELLVDIGAHGPTPLRDALAEGAGLAEEEVAIAWAVATAAQGGPTERSALRQAVADDPWARLEAAELALTVHVPELLRELAQEGPAGRRIELTLAAGEGRSKPLLAAIVDEDADVRAMVLQAASRRPEDASGRRTLRRLVQAGLRDLDPGVRVAAVTTLASAEGLGDELGRALTDPLPFVRVRAAALLLSGR